MKISLRLQLCLAVIVVTTMSVILLAPGRASQLETATAQTDTNETSTSVSQNQTSASQTIQNLNLTSDDFSNVREALNTARDAILDGNREVAYDYLTTADSELFEFILLAGNQSSNN
jgi:hypothetical protein